ncbi:MAG: radical SAM protein [Candidatus Woesearchaeota archaeon]
MDFKDRIVANNKTHVVDEKELQELIEESSTIFNEHHTQDVWFERSVFINWTCAIADCKYCYLSTKPRLQKNALRSQESILAEIVLCKALGYKIGYLTGGLRVEPNEYMVSLLENCSIAAGHKVRMNFGPYTKKEIETFEPHVSGIGSAIESFDEELHNFICPSKPLKSLMNMLNTCKEKHIPTFITIILGMGEKKSDIEEVIAKVKEYTISMVQLCFLKPQEHTVFEEVPAPDTNYMAWWIAKLRIACPKIIIKIALVEERMHEMSLLLKAGANCFSRFMIFKEFNTEFSRAIETECLNAGRILRGNFSEVPDIDAKSLVKDLSFDDTLKEKILEKLEQYISKLEKQI